MSTAFQDIVVGASSILDVCPNSDYARFVPPKNSQARMQRRWSRAGQSLHRAMNQFANEQQTANTTKK